MSNRHPDPRATLDRVLNAARGTVYLGDALAELTIALDRAWKAGHSTGWDDGVRDVTHDDGEIRRTRSPYRQEPPR